MSRLHRLLSQDLVAPYNVTCDEHGPWIRFCGFQIVGTHHIVVQDPHCSLTIPSITIILIDRILRCKLTYLVEHKESVPVREPDFLKCNYSL